MDMTNQPNKATVKDGLTTAEEILSKHFLCDPNNEPLDEVYVGEKTAIYSAMREYADQQNAELRKRVKELQSQLSKYREALERIIGLTEDHPDYEYFNKIAKEVLKQ